MTVPPIAGSLVIALGGNALEPGGGGTDAWRLLDETARQIAALAVAGHRIALVHGNGPQVGALLLQNEAGRAIVAPAGLDVLDAETQGQLGYLIQQHVGNHLRRLGRDQAVAELVTQVVVDAADPAFQRPTKPIGPFYLSESTALAAAPGAVVREVAPGRWRRVVASPRPQRIVELAAVRVLWDAGVIALAAGGGGIPVVEGPDGLRGVEAVVDKDHAAALLALNLGAERLLVLTNVDGVYLDYGRPGQRRLDRLTVSDGRRLLAQGQFPPGSMGPKVEACLDFVAAGGRSAVIAAVPEALAAVAGTTGTAILP